MSRIYISSPITFYVNNSTGNDANDGSSPTLAYQTIQRAVDELQEDYDFAAQPTIQLASTNVDYAENVILARYVGSLGYTSSGYIYPKIQGDPTNNAAVVVHPASGAAFTSVKGKPWIISSLRVKSNNHYCIVSDASAHLLLQNLNFGLCWLGHMCAEYGGFIETLAGPYTISEGGTCHIAAYMKGKFVGQGNQINFTQSAAGWPTFSYFAQAGSGALVNMGQMSMVAGGYNSNHPGTESNDGTALMYPMANGTWP